MHRHRKVGKNMAEHFVQPANLARKHEPEAWILQPGTVPFTGFLGQECPQVTQSTLLTGDYSFRLVPSQKLQHNPLSPPRSLPGQHYITDGNQETGGRGQQVRMGGRGQNNAPRLATIEGFWLRPWNRGQSGAVTLARQLKPSKETTKNVTAKECLSHSAWPSRSTHKGTQRRHNRDQTNTDFATL